MTMAPGSKILLSDLMPFQKRLATTLTTIPTAGFASIGISDNTLTSPGTTACWEVKLELDIQQGSASTVEILLAINGTQYGDEITNFAWPANLRMHEGMTWEVTGIAAGTAMTIDPQVKASVANSCAIYAGTKMIIKRVC